MLLQRLFSTFASGWPGISLLLLRLVSGAALIHYESADLLEAPQFVPIVPQIIRAGAGILLLVGLWTPVTGAVVAIVSPCGRFEGDIRPPAAKGQGELLIASLPRRITG